MELIRKLLPKCSFWRTELSFPSNSYVRCSCGAPGPLAGMTTVPRASRGGTLAAPFPWVGKEQGFCVEPAATSHHAVWCNVSVHLSNSRILSSAALFSDLRILKFFLIFKSKPSIDNTTASKSLYFVKY